MSEKEKQIVEKLKETLPNMSDFDKGYLLGKAYDNRREDKTSCSG